MGARGLGLLHVLIFAIFLSLWTWKLLVPTPVPEAVAAQFSDGEAFIVSKSFHAAAYAFLTVLAVTMPLARRWRLAVVAFLVLHGAIAEIAQTFVPNRHGSVRDALIDWGGISVALLLWLAASRRKVLPV